MPTEKKFLDQFQDNLTFFFNEAVDMNLTNLKQCGFWIKTMNHQNNASEIRKKRIEKGLPAPSVMICSVTNRCNLQCKGCYHRSHERQPGLEITTERFGRLVKEASDIGTRIIMLAGGEPLLRKDMLETAAGEKGTIFPVFTNGVLLDTETTRFFKKNRNLIPVLSIEGDRQKTDERRGAGLYDRIESAAEVLRRNKMFYGLSITLTSDNFDQVMDPEYLQIYYNQGCRLFFFVEYVPVTEKDIPNCLTPEQRKKLPEINKLLRQTIPALYITLPGEEEQYGGCLAAGRGFVHISATGDVEPCPFAPYSDTNINHSSFTEALDSLLLSRIRDNHHLLKESAGGCTLWENKDWVEEQLDVHKSLSA
jgi:MoaA/NifB/PqqE/SkfB family radical SAM enzyme